jgi:CRISPR-associated protein Csm2
VEGGIDMAQPQWGKDRPKVEPLDLSFLDKGFYTEEGILREELLDKEAKRLAERFGPRGGFDKVSSTQMRKFFGEVRELEKKLKEDKVNMKSNKKEDLERHLPVIKMMKSKLAYASGRKAGSRGLISRAFAVTLSKAIEKIESPKDFNGFLLFFESIVGYYYGEGGDKIR